MILSFLSKIQTSLVIDTIYNSTFVSLRTLEKNARNLAKHANLVHDYRIVVDNAVVKLAMMRYFISNRPRLFCTEQRYFEGVKAIRRGSGEAKFP